jgi:hypothetical protein
MVRSVGIEPTQDYSHMPLKHACLPVPPRPHKIKQKIYFSPYLGAGSTGNAGACLSVPWGMP